MSKPTYYVLRVREQLDPRWTDYLAGLEIIHEADGNTTLFGPLPDQAALHGVLAIVRDLGLTLISVQQVEERGHLPG
ncbi:MAG TPA: hypothetical protein VNK95_25305 [Caldilineaceae bacterium]|nr:hypothetical protein [Caldilineaceae bacterium]